MMQQLETGEESVAFIRALEHLTEGGWSFEDDEGGGNRRAFEIVFCAGRDYARSQTDPVREALASALRDVTNELQAWHDERPDSPGLRDLCVSCGYLDEARSVIAAAEEPREEGQG